MLVRVCCVLLCCLSGCTIDVSPSGNLIKQMDQASPEQWGRTEQALRSVSRSTGCDIDSLLSELALHWGKRTKQYDLAFVSLFADCAKNHPIGEGTIVAMQNQIGRDPRLVRQIYLRPVVVGDNLGKLDVDILRLQQEMRRSPSRVCAELRSKQLSGSADSGEAFYWLVFLAGMYNRPEMVFQKSDEPVCHRLEQAIEWVASVADKSVFSPNAAQFDIDSATDPRASKDAWKRNCSNDVMRCFGKSGSEGPAKK